MARDLAARLHVASGLLLAGLWLLVVADLASRLSGTAAAAGPSTLARATEPLMALLMALAMLRASKHIRLLAGALLLATLAAGWAAHDWRSIERGLVAAGAIGAFLPVVALLRATTETSPLVPAMRRRLGEMTCAERRAWATGSAHLLGAILTLGFVSVQRPMLSPELGPAERGALAECGVRGMGLAMVWSPFFVISAVAGQLVPGVAAWQIVLDGLALSALGGGLAHWMFNRGLGRAALARALARLAPLLPPTVGLVGAVVLASALTGWSALQAVVAIIPAACVAYVLARAPRRLGAVLRQAVAGAGRMGDEVLILTVSTVFAGAVAGTALPEPVARALGALGAIPAAVIALEVGLIATLGILGVHPIVTAAVLVPTTAVLGLPIAGPVLAHLVVFGSALSAMVAAWTLPVVMTAAAFQVPVRRLVMGRNLGFVLVFYVVGCVALWGLNAAWR